MVEVYFHEIYGNNTIEVCFHKIYSAIQISMRCIFNNSSTLLLYYGFYRYKITNLRNIVYVIVVINEI